MFSLRSECAEYRELESKFGSNSLNTIDGTDNKIMNVLHMKLTIVDHRLYPEAFVSGSTDEYIKEGGVIEHSPV